MTAARASNRKGTTMQAQMFDGMAREMGNVVPRRSVFRLLGGAAVAGAGLALAAQDESLGKQRGKSKSHAQVSAQGKGKKITICYLNKTRSVKKSKLDNYPGATRGVCPGGNGGGGTTPQPQPVICTRWVLSGGPGQSDKISADDDLGVYNLSQGGAGIINEFDRRASVISPAVFDARVGDRINIVGYDAGGCRSLSQMWLHCLATGESRKVFAGYNGANCLYSAGTFVNYEFII